MVNIFFGFDKTMSSSNSENEKKRKTPIPVIDITLEDSEDDYNRSFSSLSDHESEEQKKKKHITVDDFEQRESDIESGTTSEEPLGDDDDDDDDEGSEDVRAARRHLENEDGDEDSEEEVEIIAEKHEKGRKSRSNKSRVRVPPAAVAVEQLNYVDLSPIDDTFQVMYTPLTGETRTDPTTNQQVEYSIGFITVVAKEVSEDEFLTLLYAAHRETNNSRIHFSNVDMKHCCEASRSISYVGKLFIQAGISKERVVELIHKARCLGVPETEKGEKQLLFVAIRMPQYLLNAVQSPILSYNLRVRVLSEKLAGASSLLPGASRFAGHGIGFSASEMKPLVMTNDEVHRYTFHIQSPLPLRCNENLPIFGNAAFELEGLRLSPIRVDLPTLPRVMLTRLTTTWSETDPQTIDRLVPLSERAAADKTPMTEEERISFLFRAVDTRDRKVGWRAPERHKSKIGADYLVIPQHSRNLTARTPSNLRYPVWVQTPVDRFTRAESMMFFRAPTLVSGPCFFKNDDGRNLNIVSDFSLRRAQAHFKKNMQLRHDRKLYMRNTQKVEITDKCLAGIDSRDCMAVWLDMTLETNKKLQKTLAFWTTPERGRNDNEVRFHSLYQHIANRPSYLDSNGWPTLDLVRCFAFASASMMNVDFWLVACVLSFETAMVCLLRGVLETVGNILKGPCPQNLLVMQSLPVTGPSMMKTECANFIRDRGVKHELDSLALFAYSITAAHEKPWAWDLTHRLEDPTSSVFAYRRTLDVLRLVSQLFKEESSGRCDFHTSFISNHLIAESRIDDAALTDVRVQRVNSASDNETLVNALFQTESSASLSKAFSALFSPIDGPFRKCGIEVVRCETRVEHDRSLVIAAARINAQGRDLVVFCGDELHVQLAAEALGETFRELVLYGAQLHEFLTTRYGESDSPARIMLLTSADRSVLFNTTRYVLRERARLCLAYAHRYSQKNLVTLLNALTSKNYSMAVVCSEAKTTNDLFSRDEAAVLVAAHWGSEYESNIAGVRQMILESREAAICGDELIVIGLPLTPWAQCDTLHVRHGASLVDDLFFAAQRTVSFDDYCGEYEDAFPVPVPFLRCVSCAGGFMATFNDPTEAHDQFLRGEQTATIGETPVKFLMRDPDVFGVSSFPPELNHIGVYIPPKGDAQMRLTTKDIEYEATADNRKMTILSPVPHRRISDMGYSDQPMSWDEWNSTGFIIVDLVPSNAFVNPSPLFSKSEAAKPLIEVTQLRYRLTESHLEEDEIAEIVSCAKKGRNPAGEAGSIFDVDVRPKLQMALGHFKNGSAPVRNHVQMHGTLMAETRMLKRGLSIDAIMALFFYEPKAVVWHGDMLEAVVSRFNARLAQVSFNKTPLEEAMSNDEFPNWYYSYMLCANSPLPYVLGELFAGHTII